MTARTYLFSAALIALSSGCDKESDGTTLSGQVVERGSGRPVSNATVQLHSTPNTGAGAYQPTGDPHPCDAQGRFTFALPDAPGGNLILMASSQLGHYTAYGEAPQVRAGKANNNIRVPVYAPAWLQFKLVDEPPRNRVWITIGGSNTLSAELPYPNDTTFVRPITATENYRVTWDINDGGIRRRVTQDVNVPALDTLTVNIRF